MNTEIDNNIQWPHLPPNIQGVNYDLIDKISNDTIITDDIILYINNAKKFSKKYSNNTNQIDDKTNQINGKTNQINDKTNQIDDSNNNDPSNNFDREAPPLNFSCIYSTKDGCVKKAAFKHKLDGAYCCWFHKNLYKPSNT